MLPLTMRWRRAKGASERSISEIYARTPASKFVVAKRTRTTSSPNAPGDEAKARNGGELYMLVGRKDASLTDAEREHAVCQGGSG